MKTVLKVNDGVQACLVGLSPVVMPCCNVMLEPAIPSRKRVFVDSRHLHN